MWASSPGGPRKGHKKILKCCFLKKVCENTYVGAAVKIGIVDGVTTTIGRWTELTVLPIETVLTVLPVQTVL